MVLSADKPVRSCVVTSGILDFPGWNELGFRGNHAVGGDPSTGGKPPRRVMTIRPVKARDDQNSYRA